MLTVLAREELTAHPVVTDRLFLVPIDVNDGQDLWFAVNGSRDTLRRFLPWVSYHNDITASVRFAEACALDWDQGRAFRFVIRDREKKKLLGVVGLESLVHMHRSCELGYWLTDEASGKGFMTEAASAALDYAFGRIGAHRVRIAAATDNHPSLGVIGRLGFRFEGIAREAEWCDGRWLDHAVFALLIKDPRPGLRKP
ncbi:MAG: GNAT family N-acetyltransferase [Polyangiaceae bacterium]|nr:GNAT family N-acetyltransferase [Polyangiaceae bacterium]